MSVSNGTRLGPPISQHTIHKALEEKSQRIKDATRKREAGWELEGDNRYSPEQFFTRASDAQGHKEHIRVNVPPYMASQMAALVESDKFPYQTMADIMRDALYHRLHHLSTKKGGAGLHAVVSRYRREARMADYLEEMRSVDDFKEEALKIVDEGLNKRDYAGVRHELDFYMEEVGYYREPFQSDIRKLLKDCYVRLNRAEKS